MINAPSFQATLYTFLLLALSSKLNFTFFFFSSFSSSSFSFSSFSASSSSCVARFYHFSRSLYLRVFRLRLVVTLFIFVALRLLRIFTRFFHISLPFLLFLSFPPSSSLLFHSEPSGRLCSPARWAFLLR